jgi:hypothetical protein
VVGQAGSLSTLLLPRLIHEMPVGECPGRWQWRQWQTIATRWRLRSSFAWGTAGSSNCREVWFLTAMDLNYVIFVISFFVMFDQSFSLFGLFWKFRDCVIFLSAVALDSIYAVPLKKDLHVCVANLLLPRFM